MWCHDDRALSWLKELVPKLTSPKVGTGLTVIQQSDIPVRVRSGLFVPDFDAEIGHLYEVLSLQNPWYNVSLWTLYSYQKTTSSPPGVFLILGIPKEELPNILARGRKVAYSTGSIYIRFFTDEGLSDVPPEQEATSATPGPRMEVDEPCGVRETTPEPSVGTVLDNIEALLTEGQADHPQRANTNTVDPTAPAAKPPAQRAP
ncbi:uncharacterized protein LOC120634606 [Pararge aegeria]|uniref:uncharacterized protein LOC120634606 n=1 Tax=Pararge aegeria TaxID=116150 RepID=UPI0019D27778|nr:uncharacterized protein LOC120634606 [Pararge aegeria]